MTFALFCKADRTNLHSILPNSSIKMEENRRTGGKIAAYYQFVQDFASIVTVCSIGYDLRVLGTVLAGCAVLACVFLMTLIQTRQALKWWMGRQSAQLWHRSEQIRDGMLQEMFTIRRGLELSLIGNAGASAQESEVWLSQMEKLHSSLETLSNDLSPLYLEDSLPLAIQSVLEAERQILPQMTLSLPAQWHYEAPERSRIILTAFHELIRLAKPDRGTSLRVGLEAEAGWNQLTVQWVYADLLTAREVCSSREAAYLSRAFQYLAAGQCFFQREGLILKWFFRWKPSRKG